MSKRVLDLSEPYHEVSDRDPRVVRVSRFARLRWRVDCAVAFVVNLFIVVRVRLRCATSAFVKGPILLRRVFALENEVAQLRAVLDARAPALVYAIARRKVLEAEVARLRIALEEARL